MVATVTMCLVGEVNGSDCNYLYGRDVDRTGKFCAGRGVDACQVNQTSSQKSNIQSTPI